MRITTVIIVAVVAGVIPTGCREEATPAPASQSPSPSESASNSQSVDPDDDSFEGLAGRWEHETEDQQHSSYLDIEANGSLTYTLYEEDTTYTGVLTQEDDFAHFNLGMVAEDEDTEINMEIWLSANGEVLTASIDHAEEIGFLRGQT